VDSARIVVAEINDRMPRTHGNTVVQLSQVTAFTEISRALPSTAAAPPSAVDERIADRVAALVPDGATLQLGIGAVPNAVLARLHDKHDLGVHTEMFSDGLIPLIESGVVTNRHKRVHTGRTVTSFVSGTQRLYDFVDDNPLVELHGCDRTNDAVLIRKNPRIVAINSAIEIDLSGQVCADSVGHRIVSGIGGQMDFMHAASSSEGGIPIIAMPSMAQGGACSRIVSALRPGAGVVTTRGHVHWVVTEWGAVDLHGMTLRERAEALISIAHPDARAELRRAALETRHFLLGT
jgi:acyl-CoA hydrolase